jgi:hypothetical protein
MKNILLFWFIVICLLPNLSNAQWVQTSGPGAGDINAFLLSGSNVFAACGASKGIYLSTNNGANWTPVNNGLNLVSMSNVYALAQIGSNIFAGGSSLGVYMSTNNGTSWTAANTGISSQNVQALTVIGTYLFAGTSAGGAFISTDNGTSWTAINNGIPSANVKSLSSFGTTIYAGMNAGGLYVSTNNGSNWTAANSGISGYTVSCLATNDGVNLFASTTNNGVYYSTNSGTSWANISTGLVHPNTYSLLLNGTNLFAATFAGISYSTNNGTSWTTVNSGIPNTVAPSIPQVNALLLNGSTLFLGSSVQGIFATTNNGTNWYWSSNGLTNSAVQCLLPLNTKLFAGTTYNGIVLSTDGGASWSEANNGMTTGSGIYFIINIGSTIFCAPNNKGVWMSTNNGTSWSSANGGVLDSKALRGFAVGPNGTDLFAGEYSSGVWKSTNNGTSWAQTNTGLPATNIRALYVNGSNIYVGLGNAPGGLCISTNNGATWSATSLPAMTVQSIYYMAPYLFAGSSGSGIYRSSDNGATWAAANTGFSGLTVNAFISDGFNLFCSCNSFGTIYQSTDQGSTWIQINTNLVTANGLYGPLAFYQNSLFLGTGDNGVWSRPMKELPVELISFSGSAELNAISLIWKTATENNNAGFKIEHSPDNKLWNSISFVNSSGNSNITKTYSFIDKNPLNGKNYYRLVQLDLNGTESNFSNVIEIDNNTLPKDFSLSQNYPNPFNPTTTIQYSLPVDSHVRVEIYNMLGQKVEVLTDKIIAAGYHDLVWNGMNYASGVYFYSLHIDPVNQSNSEINSQTLVKKMIMMK